MLPRSRASLPPIASLSLLLALPLLAPAPIAAQDDPPPPTARGAAPAPRGALTRVDAPFIEARLRPGRPVVEGDDLAYEWGQASPRRALLRTEVGSDDWPWPGALFDLDSGDELVSVGVPARMVASSDGWLRVYVPGSTEWALLDPTAATVHQPVPLSPFGERLGDVSIAVDEGMPGAWLFAESADGVHYAGRWDDLAAETVVLGESLPFAMQQYAVHESGGALDVWRGELWELAVVDVLSTDPTDCRAARLRRDGTRFCLARSRSDGPGWSYLLDGDRAVVWDRDVPVSIVDLESGARTSPFEGAEAVWVVSVLRSPPRVLAVAPGDERFIWSPEAVVGWWDPPGLPRGNLGAVDDPIVFHVDFDLDDTPAPRVIDLEAMRVWELPEPMLGTRPRGAPRRAVARVPREGETQDLFVLDLDEATAALAATVECPGRVWEGHRAGDWVALACEVRPDPSRYTYVVHWSEIWNLARGRRWHTDLTVETVWPDGTAVLSDRGVLGAEQTSAATRFHVVELGHE